MAKQLIAALLLVVGLLVVYLFLTEGSPRRDTENVWSFPNLGGFSRIEVERGEQRVAVDHDGSGWHLSEPVDYPASTAQMRRVVEVFAGGERVVVDHELLVTDEILGRYGFADDAAITVALYDSGELALRFTVGIAQQVQSGETRTWIRPLGSDRIYRVDRDLRAVLETEVGDWRNRDILALNRQQQDELVSVEAAYGETGFRLERLESSTWAMVDPEGFAADPEQVARYVDYVDTLIATGFADGVTEDEAGLTTPPYTVTLRLGTGEQLMLEFGDELTRAMADSDGSERWRYVRLNGESIQLVQSRAAEGFMQRRGGFRYPEVLELDRETILAITIQDEDGGEILLVRDERFEGAGGEGFWRMELPELVDPVSMERLRGILSRVASVRANRWMDEATPESSGLTPARRTLSVLLEDGSQHLLAIGDPVREPSDREEVSTIDRYAQVDGGDIFMLGAEVVRDLMVSVDALRP